MRRSSIVLAALLTLLATRTAASELPVVPEAAANLLTNPSFTGSTNGWTPTNVTLYYGGWDATGEFGSHSGLLTNKIASANGTGDIHQCVAATAGKAYEWGGKVRVNGSQNRTGTASMQLVFMGPPLGGDECGQPLEVVQAGSIAAPPDTWFPLAGPTATAPAGTASVAFLFVNFKNEAGGMFETYGDDAYLREAAMAMSFDGPSVGSPGQPLQFVAAAVGCAPSSSGWSWEATGNAAISGGSTKSASITWPAPGAFTVKVSSSACGAISASRAVTIAAAAPAVVLSRSTSGIAQDASSSGGSTDSYVLTNTGDGSTTISLSRSGSFFDHAPSSFTLGAGANQTVTITSTAAAAGTYDGASIPSGAGVPSNLSVPVRMIVTPSPSGAADVRPGANRIDVDALSGGTAGGAVSFSNRGSATLLGVPVASAPWIVTSGSTVSIAPGASSSVTFTIDRTTRPDGGTTPGSFAGDLSLLFLSGSSSARLPDNAPTSVSTVVVVDTVKPPATATPVPPLGAGEVALLLPGVGHVTGSVGTYISDLSIVNVKPSGTLQNVKLYFTPAGGAAASTQSVPVLLAASVPVVFGDLVKTVYGQTSFVGTLQVRAPDIASIAANAVVFNASNPAGTFGTAIPTLRSDRGVMPGSATHLAGLRADTTSHTNVYLQETSGKGATVHIDFLSAGGQVLGSRDETLGAFELIQRTAVAPAGAVAALLTNDAGSTGRFLAYATPVDRASGDTWAVADWKQLSGFSGSTEQLIPIAGSIHGANETFFRTDAAFMNAGSAPASATLTYYPRDGTPVVKPLSLQAKETKVYDDVVTSLFSAPAGTIGWIRIVPGAGSTLAVTSRTYTTVSGGSATFGTGVPTVALSQCLRAGDVRKIGGIDDSAVSTIGAARPATFRTNFGLVETSGKSINVRVTVRYTYPAGLVASPGVASKDYSLNPYQLLMPSNVAREIIGQAQRDSRLGDLRNIQVEFAVTGGDGSLAVFTSSVDNGTGDSVLRVE